MTKTDKTTQAQKTATRPWQILMVAPFVLLIVTFFSDVMINFFTNNGSSANIPVFVTIIKLINRLITVTSILMIFLLPVWIFMYTKAKNQPPKTKTGKAARDPKDKTTALLLAIFLAQWTWLYTYDRDHTKFWVNTVLAVLTAGFWLFVAWVWAILDTAKRPKKFYLNYPNS